MYFLKSETGLGDWCHFRVRSEKRDEKYRQNLDESLYGTRGVFQSNTFITRKVWENTVHTVVVRTVDLV